MVSSTASGATCWCWSGRSTEPIRNGVQVPLLLIRGIPALVALIALLWISLVTLDGRSGRTRSTAEITRQFRHEEAATIASQMALAQLTVWRERRRFTADAEELMRRLPGSYVLEPGHEVRARTAGDSFLVVADGFALRVDYGDRTVAATCVVRGADNCVGWRWTPDLEPRYLLP